MFDSELSLAIVDVKFLCVCTSQYASNRSFDRCASQCGTFCVSATNLHVSLSSCSYDTIVAMDEAVRQQLLHLACEENSTDTEWCWPPSASPHPPTVAHMHVEGFVAALCSRCPDCDIIKYMCHVSCIESEISGRRSPACCKACNMPFLSTASLNQARSQQHPKALVLSTSWRRYAQRVCSLGAFSYYCGADELAARGGTALLQAELSRVLLPGLAAARRSGDISRCVCAALCPVQIRDVTLTRLLWCAVVGARFSLGAEAWPRFPLRQAARHPHHSRLRGFDLHAPVKLCITDAQRTPPHALHCVSPTGGTGLFAIIGDAVVQQDGSAANLSELGLLAIHAVTIIRSSRRCAML